MTSKKEEEKKKYLENADKLVVRMSSDVFRGEDLVDMVVFTISIFYFFSFYNNVS